ncbi:MAG: methyl-accepting chemotaxis protein [Oleiphilus sp.]|nr:MAG: methyl-accepting chemotaxis protein [Oleiphilus sp.]
MNWLNSSIANKLMATIFLGSLVVVAASVFSNVSSGGSFERYESLINQDIRNERQINAMLTTFKTQIQEWKNTLLRGHDEGNREKYWSRFQEREVDIQALGQKLLKNLPEGESRSLVGRFLDAHSAMGQSYRGGYAAFEDSGYDHRAGDKAVQGIDREPAKLLSQSAELIAGEVASASQSVREAAAAGNQIFLGVVLAAIVLSFFMTLVLINRAIIVPSRALIASIQHISQGDLSDHIVIRRQDELGQLADASRQLQEFLKDLATGLSNTNVGLTAASEKLNQATDGVKERVDAAHDTTEHVASAMAEMSATAQEVANHAASAADAAKEADQAAVDSVSTMQNAQSSVNRLSEQVGKTVETVKKLAEDTNEVGTVLSVIRGIAEQTNLLALNAAIEAARAGEQGRGFAVVADEVRTLAQKTQQSTEEIEGIINNVQNGAKDTVSVMDASAETTNQSATLFAEAADKLNVVTQSVERITDLSHQVATAAEEQTNVSEDITRTIVEVSDLVEETVSSASATRETAQELAIMAADAARLAKRFS